MNSVEVDFPCQRCKITNKVKFYKTINVDEEKELYELVDNKTIFNFKCPKCGVVDRGIYPFICYSKKNKYAILFSNEADENKRKLQLQKLGIDNIKNIDKYTTRTVSTLEDMNEKVRIFEHKLNDALVEAARIWFVANSDVKIDELRFYKIEDDFIKWIVAFDGQLMGARLPMDFYRDDEKVWKVSVPNDFAIVNKDTLSKYLTRIEK